MYCWILYDNLTKSITSIYDDEKLMNKDINKLVLQDMNDEIARLRQNILDTKDARECQELRMVLENIEVQKTLKNPYYMKNGEVIQRYISYSKEINKLTSPIFLSLN